MAHKKAGGSTKNGRDSESKRLGVKVYRRPANQCRQHYRSSAWNQIPPRQQCWHG